MKKVKKTILILTILVLASFTIGITSEAEKITTKTDERPYDGHLRVYVVEPVSRWEHIGDEPYDFGFLDFALNGELSIPYLESYSKTVTWNAQTAGYSNVKENNIMVIAAVFNPEYTKKYAYPPSRNPFNAHYVDAAAAATPGTTGENFKNETITHTVFVEEATSSSCPYCPEAATNLFDVYESGEYPFYFVAMVGNENVVAYARLKNDYNLYGYPTCFFDGGYKTVIGGVSASTYSRRVQLSGLRDTHDLDLTVSLEWIGTGILEIEINIVNNEEMPNGTPIVPTINGPTQGRYGRKYDFTFVSTDPEEHELYYLVDWGDDSESDWDGPYPSGEEVTISHTWSEEGTFDVKVKAKDIKDAETDWSDPLSVTMLVKTKLNTILFRLLEIIFWDFENLFNLLSA